jgi:hypothetical protein
VPISIRKRGGGSSSWTPDGTNVTTAPVRRNINNAMVKAIARASAGAKAWRLAPTRQSQKSLIPKKTNETYVGRVLRLTLLTPDTVEAILTGRQPAGLQLDGLIRLFPGEWKKQQATFFD